MEANILTVAVCEEESKHPFANTTLMEMGARYFNNEMLLVEHLILCGLLTGTIPVCRCVFVHAFSSVRWLFVHRRSSMHKNRKANAMVRKEPWSFHCTQCESTCSVVTEGSVFYNVKKFFVVFLR